jgi:hypothetical protein
LDTPSGRLEPLIVSVTATAVELRFVFPPGLDDDAFLQAFGRIAGIARTEIEHLSNAAADSHRIIEYQLSERQWREAFNEMLPARPPLQ